MKVIAINGSPRKNGNTTRLLQAACEGAQAKGAEVEWVDLYALQYRGCISCFACKQKNSECAGLCAVKDQLTPVLEKVLKADGLLLGSPIYVGDVTGMMRSFLERLIFANISYDTFQSIFAGRFNAAFFYTMNVTAEHAAAYENVYRSQDRFLKLFNGKTEYYLATDTLQFDDYSRYEAAAFDVAHKKNVHETQFPKDCQAAFEIGQQIV